MRLPSSPTLAAWFWLSYITVSISAALIEMLRHVPSAHWRLYVSRDVGMGIAWLIPMSLAAAVVFGCAVAAGNRLLLRWRRRPYGNPGFPVISAIATLLLTQTAVPTVLSHLTDRIIGPESMWNIVTLPAGLAVLGAVAGAACVAMVRRRWPHAGDREPAARPGVV
ncbi:MAG TPA: hypothetical protein VGM77_06080 [Gemmatimonadales bacterium]|jgi:hypothetical protein